MQILNTTFTSARVVKHGQRRKVEGLVLSGPWVQIPSLAPLLHLYPIIPRRFEVFSAYCDSESKIIMGSDPSPLSDDGALRCFQIVRDGTAIMIAT